MFSAVESIEEVEAMPCGADRAPLLTEGWDRDKLLGTGILKDVTHAAIWDVSTAKSGTSVRNLIDGRLDTFWQSNSAVPHFITAQFEWKRKIAAVEIFTNHAADDTYTPKVVVIRVGDHLNALNTVADFTLSNPNGWITFSLSPRDYAAKIVSQNNAESELAEKLLDEWQNHGAAPSYFTCSVIQIGILANFQNGQDTHVRQVRILALPD